MYIIVHIHHLIILTYSHHKNNNTIAIKFLGLFIICLNHNFKVPAFIQELANTKKKNPKKIQNNTSTEGIC